MSGKAIDTYCFALVVVRKGERFLLVQERKHGRRWYLPAGRVERGETFAEAARRETLEEAGIPIVLTGILRIEHTPMPEYARMRVIFVAEATDETPPKSVADHESLGAGWFTLDEMARMPLRGHEVLELFAWAADGAPVAPLAILTAEGAPYGAV